MHNHVQHASVFVLTPSFSSPFAPPLRRTALALLLAGCFGAAQANPALPQVLNGQATFNQQGNIFSITNTPNTIINWQSFSIHAGEITRFIQQNGNSAVLNRITGQDPSKILGALESNGKVFLINPNGIVFGQGAKVDVNGLVASSLGMTNEDFLAGKRQFAAGGVAGGVSNAGLIHAGKGGQVLLIAPNVENTGIITAPNGEVILAAGHSVQLADPGNPQLRVLVSAPNDQALNLGQIIAQGGSIGMAGALVSQRGVLNANSAVVGENGRIVLKASGQAVLADGSVTSATGAGKGGEVRVLGDQVGLFGNAHVDASGRQGGGTVLLGGDYQGKNAAVQNARQVVVNKDASIAADAIDSGQGGKVIVWGDASARVHGSISARGGAAGGDGGFVETSGHYLAVDGARVDTRARAARGKTGDWLLDPYDIDVVAGNGGALSGVNDFTDAPTTGTTTIGAGLISAATSNVVLQAQYDINFNAAVAITQAGVGLKAQAGNSINVNQAITTNGGALILSANDNGGATAQGSSAVLHVDAALSSQGGSVALTGADIVFGVAGSLNVGGGNAELRANKFDGRIGLNGSGGQIVGTAVGQTLLLQADNMNLQGGVAYGGAAGGAAVTLRAESANREINLGSKAVGKLSLSSADLNAISAANLTLGHAAMTGAIGVDQAVTVASGATGPATLQLVTGGAIAIDHALAVAGSLSLTAGATVSAAGAVNVGATFRLASGTWTQNTTGLPTFSAGNFIIAPGASFLRAINGDGSAGAPYVIADVYGLQGIASLDLSNSYRLAGNIDASGTGAWNDGAGFRPIAHSDSGGFSGVLDGAGYAVSGLQIHGESAPNGNLNTGLFGKLGNGTTGTVRQLNLLGGNVSGNNNVGAVAGVVAAGGTIEQVQSSMSVAGQDGVGGLAGINQGRIAVSYASGGVSGARNLGGLVGSNQGTLTDVYATGAVGAAGNADAGIAREHIGGLAGENTGSISNAYASGAIAGGGFTAVGGLVGSNSGAMASTYWNIDSSGQAGDGGTSIGRTAAQMSRLSSFDGFAFGASPIWRIYDGYTTPMLKAFLKPLQVTAAGQPASQVYDGQFASFNGTLAYLGLLDGDTAANGSLGFQSARNVGNYDVTGLWSTKYDISLGGTTSLAITPRALTVSVGGSKVYDAQLGFGNASFVLGNVVGGDSITASGSAVFLDKNAGNGKAVHASGIALEGNGLGNYSLAATTVEGAGDITARLLNYGVTGAQSRVYDGNLQTGLNGYFEGLLTGDQVAMTGLQGSFRDKNVGTGKVVDYQVTTGHLTGADAGNYVLNGNAGSTTTDITARQLNYGVTGAQSRVYDGNLQTGLNGYFEGLLTGDQVAMAGLQGNFRDKNVGTGKVVDYQVTTGHLTGADAGNYVLSTNSGSTTADIAARTLNVSFNGINKTYDGTTGAQVNFGDDRIEGDAVSVSGSSAFGNRNAGTGKAVNVTNVALSGDDAGNYVLSTNSGSTTADIAARTLNVSFNGINKTYDGTTGAQVNFGDDRIQGDAVSVSGSSAFGNRNAGTGKAVNVTNVALSGGDAGNYVLSTNSGSTTADIAARTLNVSFNGINKTYDGTTGAQVNFGDDRIQGDAVSVSGSSAFGNRNAGTGKAVNVTNVALSGGDAGNYVLSTNSGSTTADIAARTLNVSFNGINKTYDGTTGAQVNFGDDRIQGDAVSVSGSSAFGNRNAGTGKAVNVTNVALSGGDAGNYVLSTNSGSTTADIAARTLNVSFNGINKTYDGTTGAQVNFGDDRIEGDAVSVSGSSAFGNRNVGTGKAVNVTNVALSGGDAGNYVLVSNAGSTTADIGARALNLSGVAGNKVYDGTTGARLSLGDDRIGGDSLTVSAMASFADKNVGAAKAVQLSGVALTGADAGNYVIVLPTGLLASITPASLSLAGLSAAGKVYDGTTNAAVSASANGVLGQDMVSVVGGNGNFSDKNAGVGKLVTASGFRLAGADAGNYTLEMTGGTTQATIFQKQLSTWVGSGNGLWSDAANWDGGVVPEGANVLGVDFTHSSGIVTYSAAAGSTSLKNLNSATGLLLTGGSLTLGESAQDRSALGGAAGLEISGGSLLLNGTLSADRYAQSGGLLGGSGNLAIANSFSQVAGAINLAGQLAISQAGGDLRFASLAARDISLSALSGAIRQDGAIVAASLETRARDGIVLGNTGNRVGSFSASNSAGGGIVLNNTSAPGTLSLGSLSSAAGNILIDNTGGIAAGSINANGGNVALTAHSPVTVSGAIEGNDIAITASTDVAMLDGARLTAAGGISLTAGRDISFDGDARLASGGNVAASAGANVRFGGTASFTLPAAASMSVLAKTGAITGDSGVRINRQRANVSLQAPNGAVSMPDVIFLPATSVDKSIVNVINVAVNDTLSIIKQADYANVPLAFMLPVKPDDKVPDDKDGAGGTGKSTGYKDNDSLKKTYCN